MQLIARLVVIAVFAVSSLANAAGSGAMAVKMVASDAAAMDMADCDACAESETGVMGISCDFVCGAGGFTAVLTPQSDAIAPGSPEAPVSSAARDFRGLASPPAKQPPRTLT
ncbi:MAG: hypothetical protein AAF762_02050 [Pseudomonadota bacterium]